MIDLLIVKIADKMIASIKGGPDVDQLQCMIANSKAPDGFYCYFAYDVGHVICVNERPLFQEGDYVAFSTESKVYGFDVETNELFGDGSWYEMYVDMAFIYDFSFHVPMIEMVPDHTHLYLIST